MSLCLCVTERLQLWSMNEQVHESLCVCLCDNTFCDLRLFCDHDRDYDHDYDCDCDCDCDHDCEHYRDCDSDCEYYRDCEHDHDCDHDCDRECDCDRDCDRVYVLFDNIELNPCNPFVCRDIFCRCS